MITRFFKKVQDNQDAVMLLEQDLSGSAELKIIESYHPHWINDNGITCVTNGNSGSFFLTADNIGWDATAKIVHLLHNWRDSINSQCESIDASMTFGKSDNFLISGNDEISFYFIKWKSNLATFTLYDEKIKKVICDFRLTPDKLGNKNAKKIIDGLIKWISQSKK